MMAKIYRDKVTGKKLYPVCGWEENQHKIYTLDIRSDVMHELFRMFY